MAIQLAQCTDSDFPRLFDIFADGFKNDHEYVNVVFPAHQTPEGRKAGAVRLLAALKNDPHTTFLKVTDTTTNEIMGFAKWNVWKGVIPPETGLLDTEDPKTWESEKVAEYAGVLFEWLVKERRAALREEGGHLVSLDILCVDPKHHYRGAGRMLVDWGTKVADDLDYTAVVEASTIGRHLYETCGFVFKHPMKFEKHVQFGHMMKMEPLSLWMVRPKRSVREQGE